jgi:ABC-type uncharacterized transport system auxiliary subunit
MRTKIALSALAVIALTLTGCTENKDETDCDTFVSAGISVPAPRPVPPPRVPSMTKPAPSSPRIKPAPKAPTVPKGPRVHTICHEGDDD